MNSTNLEVVITAKDEATTKLQGFSNKIKDLQPAFQKMAAVGVAAFASVTAVVMSSVQAYAESERSQRQLEHAIVGVSKGTQSQVKEVNALTMALQKKAGIDGDALNAGVAQLSTFGLQSKSVVALTKSLADLTVNQNGVTAGADAYISSANVMAKALNGQFGILEKSGIRFTDAQQHLIQFGTETQRIAALQEGFAQNLRETTDTVSGYDVEIGKLKQQFGEVQETIGKALQPVLTKLAEVIVPILTKIAEWIEANPNLTTGILIAVGVLGALATVVGVIGLALPSLIAGFELLGTTFFVVTGIIVGLGVILYNTMKIFDLLANHSEEIMVGYKLQWQGFKDFIFNIMLKIGDKILSVWNGIRDTIKGVITEIIDFFKPFIAMVENALNKLEQIAAKVKGGVSGAVSGAVNYVQAKFAQGGNAMGGSSYLVGENGPELFSPSRNGVVSKAGSFGSGQSFVVNINGGTYLSRDVAEEIGDMIIDNLKKVARI